MTTVVVHTWTCPKHGLLHTFEDDPSSATDAMAPRRSSIDPCGEHVRHIAEPKS